MNFLATKAHVSNRGVPPDSFLIALVEWGRSAKEEIFAVNDEPDDVYDILRPALGPWQSIAHRRAAMLEMMRVLAGFESSWNWNEGHDVTNPEEDNPETMSAGAFQCSWDSRNFGDDLKRLAVKFFVQDGDTFQKQSKEQHVFAMEWVARLTRYTTHHHGPLERGEVTSWVSRDAVAEFMQLLAP